MRRSLDPITEIKPAKLEDDPQRPIHVVDDICVTMVDVGDRIVTLGLGSLLQHSNPGSIDPRKGEIQTVNFIDEKGRPGTGELRVPYNLYYLPRKS